MSKKFWETEVFRLRATNKVPIQRTSRLNVAERAAVVEMGIELSLNPITLMPVIVGLAITLVVHDALALRCKQCAQVHATRTPSPDGRPVVSV